MQEVRAIMLEQHRYGDWASYTLGAPTLATAQPGQYVAVRRRAAPGFDPLVRQALYIAAADRLAGTCKLLVATSDPAFPYLEQQAVGSTLEMLGPLGKGWQIERDVRTLALVGIAPEAPALFALAHAAVEHGAAVTVIIGASSRDAAPPPFLLPPAAEYHIAPSKIPAAAAIALLDDNLLRWADLLALALPREYWAKVAQRVTQVRIRWSRGFAQAAVLSSGNNTLACCVGVCGVCTVETRNSVQLTCVDGPIFDLRDLVR